MEVIKKRKGSTPLSKGMEGYWIEDAQFSISHDTQDDTCSIKVAGKSMRLITKEQYDFLVDLFCTREWHFDSE